MLGDIVLYDIYEMILLASESLSLISDDFVLEISHLGILSSLLNNVCENKTFHKRQLNILLKKTVMIWFVFVMKTVYAKN